MDVIDFITHKQRLYENFSIKRAEHANNSNQLINQSIHQFLSSIDLLQQNLNDQDYDFFH